MKANDDIYRFMDGEVDQIWLNQCLSEVTFLQWSCPIGTELSFWKVKALAYT